MRSSTATTAVGIVFAWSAAAHAQDLATTVRAAIGYDSNPLLAAVEDTATPGTTDPAAATAYANFGGNLQLASGESPRLSLAFDGDARVYFDDETLTFLRLIAGCAVRVGHPLRLVARLETTRIDTSLSRDEATTARLRFDAVWAVGEHITLGAEASAGARAYDTGDQRDALFAGGLEVRVEPGRGTRISGGLDLERRESDVLRATRWELEPWMTISVALARTVRLGVSYAFYVRAFEVARRSGVEHVAHVETTWMPWTALGLFASVEGGLARGNAEALHYQRIDALVGVRATLGQSPRLLPVDEPGRPDDTPMVPDGPASIGERPGLVHFRVTAPRGARVSIIGSFNDWSAARGALVERTPGIFEAELAVRPGRHTYRVLVDDEPVRPANASRYLDDGFGGEDAVLDTAPH